MSKKGGGGVISNPKQIIANLRKLAHIYKFSQKKAQCNFQKWGGGGGGGKGRLEFFQKNIQFGKSKVPNLNYFFDWIIFVFIHAVEMNQVLNSITLANI